MASWTLEHTPTREQTGTKQGVVDHLYPSCLLHWVKEATSPTPVLEPWLVVAWGGHLALVDNAVKAFWLGSHRRSFLSWVRCSDAQGHTAPKADAWPLQMLGASGHEQN